MGFLRERKLKNGNTRFQAEIRLKGVSKAVTAVFDRKTDAKAMTISHVDNQQWPTVDADCMEVKASALKQKKAESA